MVRRCAADGTSSVATFSALELYSRRPRERFPAFGACICLCHRPQYGQLALDSKFCLLTRLNGTRLVRLELDTVREDAHGKTAVPMFEKRVHTSCLMLLDNLEVLVNSRVVKLKDIMVHVLLPRTTFLPRYENVMVTGRDKVVPTTLVLVVWRTPGSSARASNSTV